MIRRNRIIKRQGALPPWIEVQNSVDAAINAFRATLQTTYTNHLARTVISTRPLNPPPDLATVPARDEAWEARERKFHEENVRQINDLVRRLNTMAPSVARRMPTLLESELDRLRGEKLQSDVWAEVKRRAEEAEARLKSPPPSSLPFLLDRESLQSLRTATRRSLYTIAKPVTSILGKGRSGGFRGDSTSSNGEASDVSNEHPAHSPSSIGLLLAFGAGFLAIAVYRRPIKQDAPKDWNVIPIHINRHPLVIARSPNEPKQSRLGVIQKYVIEPFLTMLRFFHLAFLFGPVILTLPMLLVGHHQHPRRPGKPVDEGEETWGAVWWYSFLVGQMERAGPSFIKLGQWAASRADLFPAALCDRMSKLHSSNKPHSFTHTKRVIEKAFGLRFDDIFEVFAQEPIGCGAIAQVYKATLHPSVVGGPTRTGPRVPNTDDDDLPSTAVAIKVLHPNARQTIRRDIAIMSSFAKILNAFPGMQWLSLPEEVAVFGEMMNSQLDLRIEAANLDHFERNFAKRGRTVTFPKPFRLGLDTTGHERQESREVLIEEFEDALPLKHFLRNGGGPYDDKIAEIGLDAFLVRAHPLSVGRLLMTQEMLLLDNWTHGDLHP